MATPSLAMIPSGYKDGTLYSVLPNNAGGDFNVTRGSLATRVNSNGLIEPVGTLGTDVVLNGDFEETGADQVLNGDFSQEGVEQVTNGDFATDTDWSKSATATISSGVVTLTADTSVVYINQTLWAADAFTGKTVKVTYTITSNTLNIGDLFINGLGASDFSLGVIAPSTVGTHSVYVSVLNRAGTDNRFAFLINSASTSGAISIDNVSVVEVGQDWFVNSKWSVIDNAVRLVSTDTLGSTLSQDNVFIVGKNYKITLDAEVVSGIAKLEGSGGFGFLNIEQTKSYSVYWVADKTAITFNRVSTIADMTITNITVEEVGQDWTLNGEVSITAQGARITSDLAYSDLTQNNVLVVGDTYEMEYEITESVIGGLTITGSFGTGLALKSTVGVHKFYAVATNTPIQIKRSGVTDITIDNIKVKRLNGDDTPRIDYTDGGCPVLLTEPQSTNLITQSNNFNSTYWTKSNTTVAEGFVSPDGNSNAYKLVENSSLSNKDIKTSGFTTVSGEDYTISIFAKPNGRFLQITPSVAFVQSYINYDLSNGIMDLSGSGSASGTITLLSNGYYRCTYTATATATSSVGSIFYGLVDSISSTRKQAYQGDGTSGVYIYGAQIEELSYATSLIPTYGAVRTRLQDTVTGAGTSSDFNDSEGVLFAEINFGQPHSSSRYIALSNGTNNNRVIMGVSANITGTLTTFISSGGSTQANMSFPINLSENHKVAVKYKENDFSLWIDGVRVFSDNSGLTPVGLNNLRFSQGDANNNFFGKTSQVQVFNTALSDFELTQLTTI